MLHCFRFSSMNHDELKRELQYAFDAFGLASGASVCLRGTTSHWSYPDGRDLLEPRYTLHLQPFCMKVKRFGNASCIRDCARNLAKSSADCISVFECYAGAHELRLPVKHEGKLVAFLFVGQFRLRDDQPSMLPLLSAEELLVLKRMAGILCGYIRDWFRGLEALRFDRLASRKQKILAFIDRHLDRNPSLTDLGQFLNLSEHRVRHVVKEETGKTFSELKSIARLEAADFMLSHSHCTVCTIAGQLGFQDVNYFCRYYKNKRGCTPTEFRQNAMADSQAASVLREA